MNEEPARQLTPIELATPGNNEYEVWASQETATPTVLIVISDSGKSLKIIDPSASNSEVLSSDHYLDIVAYLRDEEYLPVKGRMKLKVSEDDDHESSPL